MKSCKDCGRSQEAVRVKDQPEHPPSPGDRYLATPIKEEADNAWHSECLEETEHVKQEVLCVESVQQEPSCTAAAGARGVSAAAALAGLYTDHAVKDELVLGPEVPYRPDVTPAFSYMPYIVSFSRGFIFELWLSSSGSDTEKRRQVLQQLKDMVPDAENIDTANLENVIKYICQRLTVFWKSAFRKKSTVLNKHSKWLSKKESVNLPKLSILKKNTPHDISDDEPSFSEAVAASGRPRKDFAACSKQSQHRRLKMLAQFDDSAVRSLRKTSGTGTCEVDPDDVLSLITEAKLTKHQYLLLRKFINSRSNPVLPSYGKVLEAKNQCYPEVVRVTESTAEVEFQSLLDHTAARIVESQ